jgi:hypothetical protein
MTKSSRSHQERNNLVANPNDIIGAGRARFALLTPRMVRMLRALPPLLRRLGDATNAWAPEPDPQRRACCGKALPILRLL